ncbi:hypothetical protein ACFE04_002811 [Oxalis oulophora]
MDNNYNYYNNRKGILLIILISFLLIVDGAPDATANADADATANQVTQSINNNNNNNTTDPPKVDQPKTEVSDLTTSPPPPSPPPPAASPPPPPPVDNTQPPPPPPDKVKEDPKKEGEGKGASPPPPPTTTTTPEEKKKKKKKNSDGAKSEVVTVFDVKLNCSAITCRDDDKLVACIENFETGSKNFVIIVHNEGEKALDVNISISSSVIPLKKLKLSYGQTEKISVPVALSKSVKLVLTAGHGECTLHQNPPPASEATSYLRFLSYDKIVTPINGAYLIIISVIVFGGIWGCCMFRKRERRGGVEYQELEMAMPETVVGPDLETAERWDEGWDDDWDGDNAVMSPGGHRVASISSNGLTARTPVKDGWENGWDD